MQETHQKELAGKQKKKREMNTSISHVAASGRIVYTLELVLRANIGVTN